MYFHFIAPLFPIGTTRRRPGVSTFFWTAPNRRQKKRDAETASLRPVPNNLRYSSVYHHVLRASNNLSSREWSLLDDRALDTLAANWGFPKPSGYPEDSREMFFGQISEILGDEVAAACADFFGNAEIPDQHEYLVLIRYPSGFNYVHRVIADSHKEAIVCAVLNDREKGRFENGAVVRSAGPHAVGQWTEVEEKF